MWYSNRMKYRIDYGELLAMLGDAFEVFTRRDVGLVLAGYRTVKSSRDTYQVIRQLTKQELITQRLGGEQAQFVVSAAGRQRSGVYRPDVAWDKSWDGRWRAVTYDLPESRRAERRTLWRALRDRRLGLLQRSVWIWPHPLTEMLEEIITVSGVPECFCGLEADRLFLCTHAEVVATAWNWEDIDQRHRTYLNNSKVTPDQANKAVDPMALGCLLRLERSAYQHAFSLDPLLPRGLWPKDYRGPAVERRHREFVAQSRERWGQLVSD
jgi:DNA-binding transcriptional regulator PaaX